MSGEKRPPEPEVPIEREPTLEEVERVAQALLATPKRRDPAPKKPKTGHSRL
jgi:hypothetical protein